MPKVSVIIPVYGVEKYIERCARSLFEQSLDDMEFIFVDDCTEDKSIPVLNRVINDYPQRKEQIKILHHNQNKGLSYARQTGIKVATGEYIGHCDSDDWVEKDMFKTLYDVITKAGADYVRCNYFETDGKNILDIKKTYSNSESLTKNHIINWLLLNRGWNSIWCTLVKSSIYRHNNIEYTNNAMLEDLFLSIQIISYSNSFILVDKPLYNYYKNINSISRLQSKEKIIRRAQEAFENIKWIESFCKAFNSVIDKQSFFVLHSLPRRLLIPALKDFNVYEMWNGYYNVGAFDFVLCKEFSLIEKVQYLIAYFRLYPIYSKIKNFIYNSLNQH